MMRRTRFWSLLAFAGLAMVVTVTAQAQSPPTLTGEQFFAGNALDPQLGSVTVTSQNCNPTGESTFSFTATGPAFGPYPGTFTEMGTVRIGPQTLDGFTAPVGEIRDFDATFMINSGTGNVEGEKHFSLEPNRFLDWGTCNSTQGTTANVQRGMDYAATITPPGGGEFLDSGLTSAQVGGGDVAPDRFAEHFFSERSETEPVQPARTPFLMVIDEDSIDNGNQPNRFKAADVNDHIADIGLRTPLPAFDGQNIGRTYTLFTGQVGDEGWFAPKTIPPEWNTTPSPKPSDDGTQKYVGDPRAPKPHNVGEGLGATYRNGDREALLDKVGNVTPLRATGLRMLEGERICAVVYDSNVGINYGPLNGSLKGANLGTVALRIVSVTSSTGQSSGTLPAVQVEVLDAGQVCEEQLRTFDQAPEPRSSSEPYDV